MPEPIARWNPARSVWETNESHICGHSAVLPGTFPSSGMTRGGLLYQLPTSVPLTDEPGSSSPRGLLPTPRVSDTNGPGVHGSGGQDLRTAVSLLATPTARDWKDGAPVPAVEVNGLLGRQVWALAPDPLLPTPTAMDSKASGGSTPSNVTLTDAVARTSLGASTNLRFDAIAEDSRETLF